MARRRDNAKLVSLMETMGPPISTRPWSSEFVAQTLEILPIGFDRDRLFWLKPIHADSLRVGLSPRDEPHERVLEALAWYGLVTKAVHSASWRHEEGRVILTYVAAVSSPVALPLGSLTLHPVARAPLARGEAKAAPRAIGVEAVIEHALRHLSWLVRDDPAVMHALADWTAVLAAYQPEPFRAL